MMSIVIKSFLKVLSVVSAFLLFSQATSATEAEVKITVVSNASYGLKIEGKLVDDRNSGWRNWTFINEYANASDLVKRVRNFRLTDKGGAEVPYKKNADGTFVSERRVTNFYYEIDLPIPEDTSSVAHVSWVSKNHGMVMLNDVLPTFNATPLAAKVVFVLPDGWRVSSREKVIHKNTFDVTDVENAMFLIGTEWRDKRIDVAGGTLDFSIVGEWQFNDSELFSMSSQIFREYTNLFGTVPQKDARIFLLRFPKEIGFDRWRAETRGANVTIFSSLATFKSQALQRLHEQLRHEILHLWIPNGLNLKGDYAWFYEGFAVYQALKTGVWLGQIRFEDFLHTLSSAYNLDNRRERRISLVEMSKSRFSDLGSSVYARGMLVAFLCDAAILKKSNGKRDLRAVFLRVLERHNNLKPAKEATPSILGVFKDYPELSPIVDAYVKGNEKIVWTEFLRQTGIEVHQKQRYVSLQLKTKLKRKQKALLRKLGYNRWRKVLRKSK